MQAEYHAVRLSCSSAVFPKGQNSLKCWEFSYVRKPMGTKRQSEIRVADLKTKENGLLIFTTAQQKGDVI